MTKLRLAAVDDEPLSLRRIEMCMADIPDVELVGTARDSASAIDLVRRERPAVLLLDIEMPGLNGFDLALSIAGESGPEIVFVTAYDKFAADAFEIHAVDYVLKPIESERLARALTRVRMRRDERSAALRAAEMQAVIATLRKAHGKPERHLTDIWAKQRDLRLRIPLDTVERIEAEGDYVRFHHGAGAHLVRMRINDLMRQLDPTLFLRIHRGHIVQRRRVIGVKKYGRRAALVLQSGAEAPVGRNFMGSTLAAFACSAVG